jgi:hypothetical protein
VSQVFVSHLLKVQKQSHAALTVEIFGWIILIEGTVLLIAPSVMAILWYLDIIPGSLALIFAIQDFGSFLWTLLTWPAAAAVPSTRPG